MKKDPKVVVPVTAVHTPPVDIKSIAPEEMEKVLKKSEQITPANTDPIMMRDFLRQIKLRFKFLVHKLNENSDKVADVEDALGDLTLQLNEQDAEAVENTKTLDLLACKVTAIYEALESWGLDVSDFEGKEEAYQSASKDEPDVKDNLGVEDAEEIASSITGEKDRKILTPAEFDKQFRDAMAKKASEEAVESAVARWDKEMPGHHHHRKHPRSYEKFGETFKGSGNRGIYSEWHQCIDCKFAAPLEDLATGQKSLGVKCHLERSPYYNETIYGQRQCGNFVFQSKPKAPPQIFGCDFSKKGHRNCGVKINAKG